MATKAASISPTTGTWFQAIDRRLILALIITLAVAFSFWLGSRIPNLNEKAMMAGDAGLELLGFDTVLEIEEGDSFLERVWKTAVNWGDTNKRGMAFGVMLAACLMTLLSLFQRKSFRSRFGNAFLGTLIGTPLGVCVNCAAPIAKGLHAAGTRLETTLATMISSPTLNMIVLTMLFALFPWYMVFGKLFFTIALLLVGIPILSRILFTPEQLDQLGANLPGRKGEACELPTNPAMRYASKAGLANTWVESLVWITQSLPRNLWYIVKTTVPLMLLAGLLGALLIVAVPWGSMVDLLPSFGIGAINSLLNMSVLALIGTFLPVPITFDLVIVAVLVAAGMPVKYAMVLLFTLGIFSIYSFQIIWRYISRSVAVLLFLATAGLGVAAGVVAHYTSLWDEARQRQVMYEQFFSVTDPAPRPIYSGDEGRDVAVLAAEFGDSKIVAEPVMTSPDDNVELAKLSMLGRSAPQDQPFTRRDGAEFGIDELSPFSLLRQLPPRYWGRGIATGDVHNDGWPDLLLAADNLSVRGIALYANAGGTGFAKQRLDVPTLSDLEVVNVSFVDIDDDGWLDIFVSSYRGGNYIVYNRAGRFSDEHVYRLPDVGSVLTAAVSFGDIDLDGDLDIVLGNWSLGYLRGVFSGEPVSAKNFVLVQDDSGTFQPRELEKFPGETLTSMLTDFNDDGTLDLIVGNDFQTSDVYYRGDGKGGFEEIVASTTIIPQTTDSTMSIASADIDNDLIPELYLAQITAGEGAGFARQMMRSEAVCDGFEDKTAYRSCSDLMLLNTDIDESRNKRDAARCVPIEDALLREDCVALHVIWAAWLLEDPSFCELIPSYRPDISALCADIFSRHVTADGEAAANAIRQVTSHNVLLVSDRQGKFIDKAVDLGLGVTGWAWNAKFADVDNDEWQDLYVVNGLFRSGRRESNFFFHNQGGGNFVNRTGDFGLTDLSATGGYSYVDFDNDGDLDIISVPVYGPIRVFTNNSQDGNSIVVELRDEAGNHFGIGSKVFIRYGEAGAKRQMREIQSSGGFISFDAPMAHFGLGAHQQIEEIEIRWSTGGTSVLKGPFSANSRYIATRQGIKLTSGSAL